MTEMKWAWIIWWAGFIFLGLLAVLTLGLVLPFLYMWWVGGPFYISREGEWAPHWKPMKPAKLWWREIR